MKRLMSITLALCLAGAALSGCRHHRRSSWHHGSRGYSDYRYDGGRSHGSYHHGRSDRWHDGHGSRHGHDGGHGHRR